VRDCDRRYKQLVGPDPLPFEENGQLIEELLRGITKPKAGAPGARLEKPEASNGLAAIAGGGKAFAPAT